VWAAPQHVDADLAAQLAADRSNHALEDDHPLSEREREVLQLLALGHTNKEIAERLGISIRTAETHRASLMQKLNLSSRAELVRYALATGRLTASAIAS
jgi:DNA-binding NarL/FixJ family response regulator